MAGEVISSPFLIKQGDIMANILVVDDERKMRHLLSIMIGRKGHSVDQAGDGEEALNKVKSAHYDMVITDIKMPRVDGTGFLERIKKMNIACPVVFITAFATVDSAVEAMRQGAADYITKPFEEDRILLTVERTLSLSRVMAENRALKKELNKAVVSDRIVYASKEMRATLDLAAKVAQSDSAVLLTGESGTGKELLARYIHRSSGRKDNRFVPLNCAAISTNLVESELFGHEKGAFTGASRKTVGKFEFASNGTLFLDEIGDLPLNAQSKLLRALQEKKIQRVGDNREIPVDARFICATNQNLEELVEQGNFRRDLFFRINVFPICLQPLRERIDDVEPLAGYFLSRLDGSGKMKFTEGAIKMLQSYPWPGNVRELANAVERSFILAGGKTMITSRTLSFLNSNSILFSNNGSAGYKLPSEGIVLEEIEKDFVRQALKMSGSNQTRAAALLGLSRAKFRVLLKQVKNSC